MNSVTKHLKSDRGAALVACLILCLLVVSGVIVYQRLTAQTLVGTVRRMDTGKALAYAESGVSQAMELLRQPQWSTQLQAGASKTAAQDLTNGRSEVTMTRDVDETTLVDLFSTGYYYLPTGTFTDPKTGQFAQMAVIEAKIRTRSIGDFFAVVPTQLQIAYGTDLSNATVYARNLSFASGDSALPPTQIKQAYYYSTLLPENAESFVTFKQPPVRLQSEPNLVSANSSTLRPLYQAWAGSDILPDGTTLSTRLIAPANSYGVYFCPGNLVLGDDGSGAGSDLTVTGKMVIYVAGKVTVIGNVRMSNSPKDWLAVISEGDIVLSKNSPSTMNLQGTYITGGYLNAQMGSGARAQLNFTGGFQADQGANFGGAWPQRAYVYQAPPSTMLLPFFLATEEYRILRGQFNQ